MGFLRALQLWSGRVDLNGRPLEPESSALTRLRYAPMEHNISKKRLTSTTKLFCYKQKKAGEFARLFTGYYAVFTSTFFALGLLGSVFGKVISNIPSL